MRIGITLLTYPGHNIWNNGIGQNVYHLAALFKALPFVEKVFLLNCGNDTTHPNGTELYSQVIPLVSLAEANDQIDIVIEMSGALEPEWARRFTARGGKIVFHSCGQPYVGLVELGMFGRSGTFHDCALTQEIWILPKDRQFAAMLRSVARRPVYEVPYLWSSVFLEQTANGIADSPHPFGYRQGSLQSGKAHVAIFEPNISPIKMGLIPFYICEEVERRAKDLISQLDFMNLAHVADHLTVRHILDHSNIKQAGKLSIHGRDFFAHVMSRGANIVVSHQIECSQNYLYFDALAGGYPLIHNSKLFRDVGYYYPESNIAEGARLFQLACREHDQNFDSYTACAREKIARASPYASANLSAYARRLLALEARAS